MVTRKCKNCNNFAPSGYDSFGQCRFGGFKVWGESVACREFDDSMIFFTPCPLAIQGRKLVGKGRYSNTAPRFPFLNNVTALIFKAITPLFLAQRAGARPCTCPHMRGM